MNMEIRLSIIIPVYNVEQYIVKCLESVRNAIGSNNNIEVIVVDDGSPDHSVELAQPILDSMPYARLIRQENQGLSGARNTGLREAVGEYVWFVDSDDTLLPHAIKDVLAAIKANPGTDVFASVLLHKDEATGKEFIEYKPHRNVSTGKDYMFADNLCGASQRFVLRRGFLNEHNLWFKLGVYHEDGDFGKRMLYLAKSLVILDRPVYCYLLRSSGSIMSTRKMKMNYDLIDIYHGLEKFCDEKVTEKDKWKFKMQMFGCLDCTILFSRNEINTSEFKNFYREHRQLIHDKTGELLQHYDELTWKQLRRVLHIYFFPIFYTRTKHNIKIILQKLR